MGEYAPNYEPVDRAKFEEMLRDLRNCDTQEKVDTFGTCWVLDPSYPRQDIVVALGRRERELGLR